MSTMLPRLLSAGLGLATLLAAGTALAGKADDTLTWVSSTEPENISPYHNNVRDGVILSRHIWDTLLYRDPDSGEYKGLIASDWSWVDSTTLDLTLREGLTFHNGDALTADDVAFTFNYAVQPDSGVMTRQNVDWIESAEKLGDYEVRIHLKAPFPAALEYLAGPTPIYPKAYFEEVGIDGFSREPIGSGPYRVTEVVTGRHVAMERFEDYFADSPRGQATIGKLIYRPIADPETRLAELMTGNVDWLWQIPKDQAEMLEGAPGLELTSGETMRVSYLRLDAAGRSGEDSPLTNVLVRRAIAHAIDKQAIVDNLVGGASRAIHSACFPTQFGCEQDVAIYDYDPEKARALLAEAGYPDGIDLPFHAYRDREYSEAVIGFVTAVGIRANLQYMQYAAMRDLGRQGQVPFEHSTWGSYSINDVSAIVSNFFKGGPDDYARDPELMEWLETADTSVDPDARMEHYSRALRKIADQVYWVPLFSYTANYAFIEDLDFQPYPDEVPRFYRASWK